MNLGLLINYHIVLPWSIKLYYKIKREAELSKEGLFEGRWLIDFRNVDSIKYDM